jgi:hypothetical protein
MSTWPGSSALSPTYTQKKTTLEIQEAMATFGRKQEEESEPVFLNVYGAQESIPRNKFRQPM